MGRPKRRWISGFPRAFSHNRLSFEIGGDFDINQDQSGANTGNKNYRGDIAIIYDLTGNGDKMLKLFNNETYDIIYQENLQYWKYRHFIVNSPGKEKTRVAINDQAINISTDFHRRCRHIWLYRDEEHFF